MKVHVCDERGCRAIIPLTQRYCDKHKPLHYKYSKVSHQDKLRYNRQYNANQRDQAANSFYHSKQWRHVRDYVSNRDMYIDGASNMTINDKQLIVDHIVPLRLCQDPLDTANLWCLSRHNHNIKTKMEQNMSDNQLKHVGKKWWIKVINEHNKNKFKR